ncbi:FAD-dependent oxidoreductase [Kitasatospora sp. NPDC006697]|uniref:FAD-dependent oxidoreductase n=1 Tax=Kitasatospora sp. NPDC006697 TaxID=3364020 RepID=UPI0036AD9AA9
MTEHLVVVGGDAAGMTAASQARRRRGPEQLRITAFERGAFTSYSACGIPYWVGEVVAGRDRLIARSPEQHRARGIEVRTGTEVVELDLANRRVRSIEAATGRESWTDYDQLVLATGAEAVRPQLPGFDAPGVHTAHTLPQGGALLDALAAEPEGPAVVVGGGYIGIELVEALLLRGRRVTLVCRSDEPMPSLDQELGALVRARMVELGVEVVAGAAALEVLLGPDGRPRAVRSTAGEHPARLVVLGTGVRPRTALAREAGLALGAHGGLRTDPRMRVLDADGRAVDGLWAGGDCVEVRQLVSGEFAHVALGTHANKHGLVIGANLTGEPLEFPGVVGTAVTKLCELEIGRTGLNARQATAAGLDWTAVTTTGSTRARYYPGSTQVTVRLLAERGTGRLLGGQLVGGPGTAKRVDAVAVALGCGLTVERLLFQDLGYAPPFAPVWDPVLAAARALAGRLRG